MIDFILQHGGDGVWQTTALLMTLSLLVVLLFSVYRDKKMLKFLNETIASLRAYAAERDNELHELRRLFNYAAQSEKFGVFDYDLISGKLTWNESMFDIYGVSHDEFSSAYDAWSHAVLAEDLEAAEAAVQAAIRGEAAFDTHFRIRRGNGEVVTIRAIGQVYRDKNAKAVRVVGVNQIDWGQRELKDIPRMGERLTAKNHYDEETTSVLKGRRVLLVEDNTFNRDLVTELLSKLGMLVESVEHGRAGLQRLTATHFDVILMDTQMPEMDGITATRLIRADERFAQLPIIIAMTAHNASDNPDDVLKIGMNDYLPKPIDFSKLAKTLCYWLQQLPAQSTPPAPSNNDLPSHLPPFDIPAALMRTNGNASLLRKLIVMFYEGYQQAIARLNQLCADQDYVQAERFAHSLKSVAGTLEARELFEAAFALEKVLRNRDTDELAAHIEALAVPLAPALTAAASLIADTLNAD